jgi:hypothetical protein
VSTWRIVQTAGRAVVGREYRVLGRIFVDELGQVGAGNASIGVRHALGIVCGSQLLMTPHIGRHEGTILMLLEARQQRRTVI